MNQTEQALNGIVNLLHQTSIQLNALVELLVKKNVITSEEYTSEINIVIEKIKESMVKSKLITPDGKIIVPKDDSNEPTASA